MSIEAMKRVVEAFDALPPDHPARYANLQINLLRTAIQQADGEHARIPGVLKDHQIAAMVNSLRDIALQFHGHGSLRERIANVLVPALKAEAKTDVPVAYVCPTSHHAHDGSMEDGPDYLEWADEASDYEKRVGTPLYTHPAPGVQEQDWERKERLQSIADAAAASGLFGLAQKWANNEIHSYQFTHQAAAIVLKAMLAASPAQKGQP